MSRKGRTRRSAPRPPASLSLGAPSGARAGHSASAPARSVHLSDVTAGARGHCRCAGRPAQPHGGPGAPSTRAGQHGPGHPSPRAQRQADRALASGPWCFGGVAPCPCTAPGGRSSWAAWPPCVGDGRRWAPPSQRNWGPRLITRGDPEGGLRLNPPVFPAVPPPGSPQRPGPGAVPEAADAPRFGHRRPGRSRPSGLPLPLARGCRRPVPGPLGLGAAGSTRGDAWVHQVMKGTETRGRGRGARSGGVALPVGMRLAPRRLLEPPALGVFTGG